ncbi:MAG: YggT family protein [Treponema sp.]|nr:YggT family protein [Treponema sp.]
MRVVFSILSTLVSIYALVCLIRVILTWIPNIGNSPFANFLSKICDPYLNLFRHKRFLTFGSFDFGPAVALCLLGGVATMLGSFANGGFSVGHLLAVIVGVVWNIIAAVLGFIIIILIIRLIILLGNKTTGGNPFVDAIDRTVTSFVSNITRTFTGGKAVSYKAQLITAIVALVVVNIVGWLVFNGICNLFELLPF